MSCDGKCLTKQTTGDEFAFECLQSCHPLIEGSCPPDYICDGLSQVCRLSCDPDLNNCPEDMNCAKLEAGRIMYFCI
jgi:hypothetical protein